MSTDDTETARLTPTGNDMTIYNALQTKSLLLESLAHCRELEIDLSQVGEIDSAGFQLLLLAKCESARQDKTLRLTAHSAAVREMLDFFNMAAHFGDPLVIPAREGH